MCKKILVVDDERCIADTLVAILLNSGYEATAAYDGHTALAHCEREIPELIISDVVMPGLNGVDMAIRIRSLYPSCKIVLISGHAGTADLLDVAHSRGCDFELLAKPIHPTELLKKISDLLHSQTHEYRTYCTG